MNLPHSRLTQVKQARYINKRGIAGSRDHDVMINPQSYLLVSVLGMKKTIRQRLDLILKALESFPIEEDP